jgi:uncharacterized protein YigE (DUF2233 family)
MCRSASVILVCLFSLLAGCGATRTPAPAPATRNIPPLLPTIAAVEQPTASTAATPALDSGWLAGRPGVELRRVQAGVPGRPSIPLTIVRLDPATVRLRVAYAPDRPLGLRSWFEERRPLAAINGSFFTPEHQATALLISDGVASGASYNGFGGMLAVTADGSVSLRALRDQPYLANEALDQALQSFPMLVFPGGEPAAIEDDGRRARRSVVALDRQGRVLLLASPTSDFTLRGLADWLSQSDLDVDRALNLDGGSSSALYLSDGVLLESIVAFGTLPIVLLVEAK